MNDFYYSLHQFLKLFRISASNTSFILKYLKILRHKVTKSNKFALRSFVNLAPEAAAVDLRKPFRNVCFNRPQQQRTRQSKMVHQCADLAELKQQLDEAGDNLVSV